MSIPVSQFIPVPSPHFPPVTISLSSTSVSFNCWVYNDQWEMFIAFEDSTVLQGEEFN